jgi:hypothetical protein
MSTSAQSGTKHTLEIAQVLFLDIVAYSRMAMEEQEQVLCRLQETVRATDEVTRAQDAALALEGFEDGCTERLSMALASPVTLLSVWPAASDAPSASKRPSTPNCRALRRNRGQRGCLALSAFS